MPNKHFPVDQILPILKETPSRLANITAGLTSAQLHATPSVGEWSAHEVLAHLRACDDVWGGYYILTILAQDNPTIKARNPRSWIKNTDYLEQDFHSSLHDFTKQRKNLMAVLEPLSSFDWARKNTLIGAGKPLLQTLLFHADRLARHERAHFNQIQHSLNALQAPA